MKKITISIFIFFALETFAQKKFTTFFEPEIEVGYSLSDRYSHRFILDTRNIVYEKANVEYIVKQIDVAHFSMFALNDYQTISLGFQYRFKKIFNDADSDEVRFTQQIAWKNKNLWKGISQRLRLEQRLYATFTKYRIRYKAGFKFLLDNTSIHYVKTETEALLELVAAQTPELEQRLSIVYGSKFLQKKVLKLDCNTVRQTTPSV